MRPPCKHRAACSSTACGRLRISRHGSWVSVHVMHAQRCGVLWEVDYFGCPAANMQLRDAPLHWQPLQPPSRAASMIREQMKTSSGVTAFWQMGWCINSNTEPCMQGPLPMMDAFAGVGTVSLAAKWLTRAAPVQPDQAPGFHVSCPKSHLAHTCGLNSHIFGVACCFTLLGTNRG